MIIRRLSVTLLLAVAVLSGAYAQAAGEVASLSDGKVQVAVNSEGRLVSLQSLVTGKEYAGGGYLWRLYYNTLEEKEIQVTGAGQKPKVTKAGDAIEIRYDSLESRGETLHFGLTLTLTLEDGQVRFAASLDSAEPHTIIRELQYPLVGDLALPEGYKLLTTHTGGQIFDDPVWKISNVDVRPLYMTPAQKFRQYDLQYPRNAASNCFSSFSAAARSCCGTPIPEELFLIPLQGLSAHLLLPCRRESRCLQRRAGLRYCRTVHPGACSL